MPIEEQTRFDHVMRLITSTADEVLSPGSLSVDVIEQVHLFPFANFVGDCESCNFLLPQF